MLNCKFICFPGKNSLVIVLQFYRLYVVNAEFWKTRREQKLAVKQRQYKSKRRNDDDPNAIYMISSERGGETKRKIKRYEFQLQFIYFQGEMLVDLKIIWKLRDFLNKRLPNNMFIGGPQNRRLFQRWPLYSRSIVIYFKSMSNLSNSYYVYSPTIVVPSICNWSEWNHMHPKNLSPWPCWPTYPHLSPLVQVHPKTSTALACRDGSMIRLSKWDSFNWI